MTLFFEVGLQVLVKSDVGAANRAMCRELVRSRKRNSYTTCGVLHSCIHERQFYFMANVAHLLKNIRGQYLRSDVFLLSKRTVRENRLPTTSVKVEYMDTLLQMDREN